MAQKILVLKTCDFDHDGDDSVEAAETVRFGLDEVTYEIDLCDVHSKEVHDQLEQLIGRARRLSTGRRTRRSATPGGKPAPARARGSDDVAAVREWARANGYEVSGRGRIPQHVREAYDSANG